MTAPAGDSPYDVLGVAPGATRAELHAAYRRAARRLHPDVAGGPSDDMQAVNDAWRTLADPAARAAFDRDPLPADRVQSQPWTEPTRFRPHRDKRARLVLALVLLCAVLVATALAAMALSDGNARPLYG